MLTLLVFGLPQCSLLVTKIMAWIPLGNSLDTTIEIAVSYAILGFSTALLCSPGLAILAAIFLRAGSGTKRWAMAMGYVVIHCMVTGGVMVVTERRWVTHAMMYEADYGRIIGHLILAPALSFASVVPAAAMQYYRGWTIKIGLQEMNRPRASLIGLMEWVLVSALFFTLARLSFAASYQSNALAFFYETLVVVLPSVGVGIVTLLLFLGGLSDGRSRGGFRRFLLIALIQVAVFAIGFIALQMKTPALGLHWNLQCAVAPLSTCLTGTVIAGSVVVCLRRIGYRLYSRGELRRRTA
ncbi:hypothetical protein [Stieleria mannarensis]|uniref:hypothetical protein n=1 Tax=Stieleria mannarensis TaxID=2755585 RepID=UPI0015FFA48D|nr:hypothetical protein [Rhodopirellula sp. JC639]